ncbi:SDR family NAD(P)-dependent oxidoreductase [Amycolatopsis thermoflava]|uniref:SDR family NAD(P)-dependent oxidoreductase n=1 Tax=Amycolatopsis thermoflava TaxID=84480 RepID=UPI001AE0AC32|nr:SDR family NAD(P)-dependent oxidoreductase [Amycolatopsis thermoflava]
MAFPAASREEPGAGERFEGQVALVTGGGSGIGLAVAEVLAAGGASVGLLGRNLERLRTAEKKIVAAGGEAMACPGDVRDLDSVQSAVAEVEQRYGPITFAVNAAGTGVGQKYLCDQDEESWLRTIDTNLNGSFRFCRAVVPGMMHRRRGSIVLVSSAAGKRGVPANTAYSASKWGLNGLVRSLALEVGPAHVRVNAVCPGFTDTEMVRDESLFGGDFMDSVRRHAGPPDLTWERYWRSTVKQTALRRLIDAEEVAEMTAFLLSDHARSITGQSYSIDGGLP